MAELVRNPEGILRTEGEQMEVTMTTTESFVYDPIKVNALYAALRTLDIKCVMEFANYDDDARAEALFEALYDSQVFHEIFYGLRDPDMGYEHKRHDPEA